MDRWRLQWSGPSASALSKNVNHVFHVEALQGFLIVRSDPELRVMADLSGSGSGLERVL